MIGSPAAIPLAEEKKVEMPLSRDASTLRIALEVLHTISVQMKRPDPVAVLRLREMANAPYERSLADDELACHIVHRELALRAGLAFPNQLAA
jgi:hypothetical protein